MEIQSVNVSSNKVTTVTSTAISYQFVIIVVEKKQNPKTIQSLHYGFIVFLYLNEIQKYYRPYRATTRGPSRSKVFIIIIIIIIIVYYYRSDMDWYRHVFRMATEEEESNIDDHDNVDQIEDQLENEEKEIIECFKKDLNEFTKEVKDAVNSANLPRQTFNNEEIQRIKEIEENQTKNRVSKSQEKIAEDFFKNKILRSYPKEFWTKFRHFDMFIIVPMFLSLGKHLIYMELIMICLLLYF